MEATKPDSVSSDRQVGAGEHDIGAGVSVHVKVPG